MENPKEGLEQDKIPPPSQEPMTKQIWWNCRNTVSGYLCYRTFSTPREAEEHLDANPNHRLEKCEVYTPNAGPETPA